MCTSDSSIAMTGRISAKTAVTVEKKVSRFNPLFNLYTWILKSNMASELNKARRASEGGILVISDAYSIWLHAQKHIRVCCEIDSRQFNRVQLVSMSLVYVLVVDRSFPNTPSTKITVLTFSIHVKFRHFTLISDTVRHQPQIVGSTPVQVIRLLYDSLTPTPYHHKSLLGPQTIPFSK